MTEISNSNFLSNSFSASVPAEKSTPREGFSDLINIAKPAVKEPAAIEKKSIPSEKTPSQTDEKPVLKKETPEIQEKTTQTEANTSEAGKKPVAGDLETADKEKDSSIAVGELAAPQTAALQPIIFLLPVTLTQDAQTLNTSLSLAISALKGEIPAGQPDQIPTPEQLLQSIQTLEKDIKTVLGTQAETVSDNAAQAPMPQKMRDSLAALLGKLEKAETTLEGAMNPKLPVSQPAAAPELAPALAVVQQAMAPVMAETVPKVAATPQTESALPSGSATDAIKTALQKLSKDDVALKDIAKPLEKQLKDSTPKTEEKSSALKLVHEAPIKASEPLPVPQPAAGEPAPRTVQEPVLQALPLVPNRVETAQAEQNNPAFTRLTTDPGNASVMEQIKMHIQQQNADGMMRIQLQLHPLDLGKLDIRLNLSTEGKTSMHVIADNPATLDMLQKDSRILQQALTEAGFKSDAGNMNFSLSQQGQQEKQAQQQEARQSYKKGTDIAEKELEAILPAATSHLSLVAGLDITI